MVTYQHTQIVIRLTFLDEKWMHKKERNKFGHFLEEKERKICDHFIVRSAERGSANSALDYTHFSNLSLAKFMEIKKN